MEQIKLPEVQLHQMETASATCVNCEARAALPGYATNLCSECRNRFIKYPIPLWIKLFAGGICLVVLFSLFTFPDKLSTAIHLSRGKKAAENNRYITARNELLKVTKKYPDHVEAKSYLMLAAYYNEDYNAFSKYSDELQGVEFEDDDLLSKLISAQNTIETYLADDSVRFLEKTYGKPVPDSVFVQFIARNPKNVCARYTYASAMYDADRFSTCDSMLQILLEEDDTFIPALQLMAHARRRMGDYNAAIKYCERVLEINKESAYTYGMMARIYLQQRRDKEGLEMAYKAMSLDNQFPYSRATMALAYHFTHQFEQRDALIKQVKAEKDSTTNSYFQYVYDVISNKEQFR